MTSKKSNKEYLTYEETNELVLAYRDNNDPEAAEKLLDAFEGYIVKYFNVLRRGRMAIHDRDVREFLKLYIKDADTRRNIHQYRYRPYVQTQIQNTCDQLRRFFENFEDDELLHEIYMALLILAKRYKSLDGKPRFHMYVQRAFHFQLHRQLKSLISDPSIYMAELNMYDEDGFYDSSRTKEFDADMLIDQSTAFTIDEEFETINDNWVLGYSTGQDYRDLSIMERKILKMYYVDEMSDQAIADEFGTCRATVNRRRNRAKDKLGEHFVSEGKVSKDWKKPKKKK